MELCLGDYSKLVESKWLVFFVSFVVIVVIVKVIVNWRVGVIIVIVNIVFQRVVIVVLVVFWEDRVFSVGVVYDVRSGRFRQEGSECDGFCSFRLFLYISIGGCGLRKYKVFIFIFDINLYYIKFVNLLCFCLRVYEKVFCDIM